MAEYREKKRLMFLGLPWTFTTYTIKDDLIRIDAGVLKKTQNDCYMYKVQDVELISFRKGKDKETHRQHAGYRKRHRYRC